MAPKPTPSVYDLWAGNDPAVESVEEQYKKQQEQTSPEFLRMLDSLNTDELDTEFASGRADYPVEQEVLTGVGLGGASLASARAAAALGASKLGQAGAGVAGEFVGNSLLSGMSGENPFNLGTAAGNLLASVPGAAAPISSGLGRELERTLSPVKAQEAAILSDPRALALLGQEQRLKGNLSSLELQQFRSGERLTPKTLNAIQQQENRLANYATPLETEIGRVGEELGIGGARNAEAVLIDENWKEKLPEAWEAVKQSGVFNARTVGDLAEASKKQAGAMFELGGKASEFANIVQNEGLDLNPIVSKIEDLATEAADKSLHPIKTIADANKDLVEMLGKFRSRFTGGPGNKAPDVLALIELNEDLNQYRRLDLQEFGSGGIAPAAKGSDIERQNSIVSAIQGEIRSALNTAGVKAGLPDKAFSQIGQEYGAYKALGRVAEKQSREAGSNLANIAGRRVLGTTGVESKASNAFADNPSFQSAKQSLFAKALGSPEPLSNAERMGTKASSAPRDIMESIRTSLNLSSGTPISITPELEELAAQSNLKRNWGTASGLAGRGAALAGQTSMTMMGQAIANPNEAQAQEGDILRGAAGLQQLTEITDPTKVQLVPAPRSWRDLKNNLNGFDTVREVALQMGLVRSREEFSTLPEPIGEKIIGTVAAVAPDLFETNPDKVNVINSKFQDPMGRDQVVMSSMDLEPRERAMRIGASFTNKYVPPTAPMTPMQKPVPALPATLSRLSENLEPLFLEQSRPAQDYSYNQSNLVNLEKLTNGSQ